MSNNRNESTRREKKASFYYDMAKLSFGGLVIGGLMQYPSTTDKISLALFPIFGITTTIIFYMLANKTLKQ